MNGTVRNGGSTLKICASDAPENRHQRVGEPSLRDLPLVPRQHEAGEEPATEASER